MKLLSTLAFLYLISKFQAALNAGQGSIHDMNDSIIDRPRKYQWEVFDEARHRNVSVAPSFCQQIQCPRCALSIVNLESKAHCFEQDKQLIST